MNLVSISLLLICSTIEDVAKLWINFLCLEFGSLENLSSVFFGAAVVCLSLPLFLDLSFLLLQRVHPKEISYLLERELKQVEREFEDAIKDPIEWHLWSLDKSYRVCTMKVTLNNGESIEQGETIREAIEKRVVQRQYCHHLTV